MLLAYSSIMVELITKFLKGYSTRKMEPSSDFIYNSKNS